MLERQLLTSKNKIHNIQSNNELCVQHFNNKNNYADVVLNMFNTDRFYDQIFLGWDNITVLDIGANIGLFSLYIQDRATAVYSLEPTPNHFSILKELTGEFKNIHPMQVALSDRDDVISFYVSEENSTMNSIVNEYGTKIEVQSKRLPTLLDDLNLPTVDFIKCDIEGSEMIAINDDIIAATKDRVKVWHLEVHATSKYPSEEYSLQQNRIQLGKIFMNNGYKTMLYRYDCLYAYRI